MNKTVTTLAELDALPAGSVIHHNVPDIEMAFVAFKDEDGKWLTCGDETPENSIEFASGLPYDVLFQPETPAPPAPLPEPVEVAEPKTPTYRNPKDGLDANNAVAVVYGHSDDCIEFDGLLYDEVGNYNTDEEKPHRVSLSNGVMFDAWYDKGGVWRFKVIAGHNLVTLDRHEFDDEQHDRYTDYLWIHGADGTGRLNLISGGPE
ncbi:hypothetical protein [Aeromicrobium sp. 179-A 4D2 NHS]|uniref:hypothetical protein n=1 Tax=Aeromicrobium sp. 179-A 4D2 NHS TaxID=3142375 RepID=UPI0039A3E0F3